MIRSIAIAVLTTAAAGAAVLFEIPPVSIPLNIGGQSVAIPISGRISDSPAAAGRPDGGVQSLDFSLSADLGGLQERITPLLQAQLNKADRCGDRISIERAALIPAAPAARLTIQLHFEKWVCIKALGRENPKRLVGGNGMIALLLTPTVEQGNAVHLGAQVADIDADGSLGEMLRSGSLGTAVQEKIRESILRAVEKSAAFGAVLPEAARPYVAVTSSAFAEGDVVGRLTLHTAGRLTVTADKASWLLEQLRAGAAGTRH